MTGPEPDRSRRVPGAGLTRRQLLQRAAYGAVGLGAGLSLLACDDNAASGVPPAEGPEVKPLKITELSSFPGPQFANAIGYTAQELGFFRDEGLEYTLEYPGSTVRATQSLAAGTPGIGWLDPFGVMLAQSQSFPLKALYRTLQGSPFQFGVPAGSPITTFETESVRGTRIGVSDFGGGEVPVLRGALVRLGLVENTDYQLVPVGQGGPETIAALRRGTVQLLAGSSLDFNSLRKGGMPLTVITPDYIRNFPGHTYVTTPGLLSSDRAALVAFLRARSKAMVFAQANLLAVAQIGIDYAPASAEGLTLADVEELLRLFFLDANQAYFQPDLPVFHKLGLQNPDDWESYQTFLVETGIQAEGATLTQPVVVADVVTNELIDEANNFDFGAIEALARDYKP